MGIIICDKHGRSGIVQMSDELHNKYYSNCKNFNIIRIIFRVNSLDTDFAHYELSNEKTFDNEKVKNFDEFEVIFNKIADYKIICVNCLKDFISTNNIELKERIIVINDGPKW